MPLTPQSGGCLYVEKTEEEKAAKRAREDKGKGKDKKGKGRKSNQ